MYLQKLPTLNDLIIILKSEDFTPGFNHLESLVMKRAIFALVKMKQFK